MGLAVHASSGSPVLIGAFALLRLVAGLLLALGPLAAGMLLFEPTRGLFTGWLRGLVLALIGTVGVTLVLAVELGVLLPWLTDALRVRSLGYATPAAPTELFAMTLAFSVVQFAMIAVLARVAFTRGWTSQSAIVSERVVPATPVHSVSSETQISFARSRAQRMADAMGLQLHREELSDPDRTQIRTLVVREGGGGPGAGAGNSAAIGASERLGSSWRRTHGRSSVASRSRDGAR